MYRELVHFDLFGMMPPDKTGQHVKVYGELIKFCVSCYKAFADDVRSGEYPEEKMYWPMDEAELNKFMNLIDCFLGRGIQNVAACLNMHKG